MAARDNNELIEPLARGSVQPALTGAAARGCVTVRVVNAIAIFFYLNSRSALITSQRFTHLRSHEKLG